MIKKIVFNYLFLIFAFFTVVSLFRGWFSLSYVALWFGGIVGGVLPDLDQFIYIFYLRPYELSSQRVIYMLKNKKFFGAIRLAFLTRAERSKLIFHSVLFQMVFLVLTFFVLTSSGSIFGRGLVLGFSLHLFSDQINDLRNKGTIQSWFGGTNMTLSENKRFYYILAVIVVICILGLFF